MGWISSLFAKGPFGALRNGRGQTDIIIGITYDISSIIRYISVFRSGN